MIDSLVERQIALEAQQISLGAAKYMNNAREDVSASTPAKRLVMELLVPVAQAIDEFKTACATGAAARKHTAFPYLANIESMEAAYLTARVALDKASGRSTMTGAAMAVAAAIEQHITFCGLAKTDPGLYRKAIEGLVKYPSGKARSQAMKRLLERCNKDRLQWAPEERVLLGSKLLEIFQQVTDMVEVKVHREGAKYSQARLEITPGCEAWLDKNNGKLAMLSPIYLPMLVPPRPWTGPTEGGYLTTAVRSWMIRVRRKEQLGAYEGCAQTMPKVIDALNTVQSTPWRVNRTMLNLIDEARSMNSMLAVMPESSEEPMPATPGWLHATTDVRNLPPDQHEEFLVFKAKRAKVHAINGNAQAKRANVLRKLAVAKQFVDEEAIYLPYYLDFRGRMYPFCEALNPQGDDLTKSLLEFADGKSLGETGAYWLAVNLANQYATGSIDKAPLDERVQWVLDHEREIMDSGMSPLDGEKFWHGAENPFQFLAACIEWCGYKVQGDTYVSHLPVNMDGSCSGLQHYSALLRDAIGGAAVNLVACDKPSDIYTAVAKRAQALIDSCNDAVAVAWKSKVVRKIVKQPTMTMCYAATKFGMRQQIENALRKLDDGVENSYLDGFDNFPASVYMSGVVWDAINGTVVAARTGMDYLKKCAAVMSKAGLPIDWTTPMGFRVSQMYGDDIGVAVTVHYSGQRLELTVLKEGETTNARRQGSGIAPNYVHSLDSAHLMATVVKGREFGIDYWSVIHDSFGTHACNVGLLNDVLREAFVEQYSIDRLTEFREQQREALVASGFAELAEDLPEVPLMGTLDIGAVRSSDFFFA